MDSGKIKKTVLRILSLVMLLVGLSIFVLLCWGAYKFVVFVLQKFAVLDTNIAVAIIAGSTTVIASTLAVVLGRYLGAKKERDAAHRDKKVTLYNEFLEKLFELFLGGEGKKPKQENLVQFLREIQRKIILWSGPKVLKAYAEWHKELTSHPGQPRVKSMIKMMDFFLSLRKDLGHSNKGIKHEYLIRLMFKNPELYLQMFRKNPEVTLDEIARAENKLNGDNT